MSSSFQITKNLRSDEAECPCCSGLHFDQKFVDTLQIIRDLMGIPFIYSQGGFYRCKFYNDSLSNSATSSRHMSGAACDIKTHDWSAYDKWRLIKYACPLRLSIGIYKSHIHLDMRHQNPVLWHGSYS